MEPDALIALVKESGLRGRGGAGFPTGMKWGFIPQGTEGQAAKPHYLVVNADESEPGTCKDTPFMLANPHALVEGVAIASYAIRASFAVIYVRGEIVHVIRRLQQAVIDAYAAGHLGKDIGGSASTSTSSCTPARAPTSAARRRRCSTRSRATAASRGCARRSRRRTGSTPARPS
jgi:NADH-quinone oxidoreductase subunit F